MSTKSLMISAAAAFATLAGGIGAANAHGHGNHFFFNQHHGLRIIGGGYGYGYDSCGTSSTNGNIAAATTGRGSSCYASTAIDAAARAVDTCFLIGLDYRRRSEGHCFGAAFSLITR